jgi:ribonucleotide monophosphatase NagD (HAD superfamily)
VEACTNTTIEAVVGKPSHHMAEAILDLLHLEPARCVMTGDRLETDVLMGLNAGMSAALTLTGATDLDMMAASGVQPTYVIRNLAELLPAEVQ